MAKICPITGRRSQFGDKVSHANNKARRRWEPNLQWKRIWVLSEKRFVRMRISSVVCPRCRGRGRLCTRIFREEIVMRTIIKRVSTAGTGDFYTTTKNPNYRAADSS
jgi:large subunit ribosomal protein L28